MLCTKEDFVKWKLDKTVFYLSKAINKITKIPAWKKKLFPNAKVTKRKNGNKTYILYFAETDKKAGVVTLDEVHQFKKHGIKVLAEKDGFAC